MMKTTIASAGEEMIAAQTVLGRIGTASDIAGTTIFLASRAGSFLTGATLTCDGGILVKAKL